MTQSERERLEGVYAEIQGLRAGRGKPMEQETKLTTLPEAKPLAAPEPEDDEPVLLYATDPKGVNAAMDDMKGWVDRKIALMRVEVAQQQEVAAMAEKAQWATKGTKRLVQIARARLLFYEKVKAALAAGYLVVPNMPMRALIIRTRREPNTPVRNGWWNSEDFRQQPQALPPGVGENRNPLLETVGWSDEEHDSNGKVEKVHRTSGVDEWRDVVFPVEVAKPAVMAQVARAAAFKLFDEIGIVEDTDRNRNALRGGDPILLGRIRNPRARRPDVSFFIAWAARLDRI